MEIEVKNLVANPYRNIEAYPIDRAKVEQLRNSIKETTFWDNILARPAPGNGQYQIAYGHHRLVAIKEELGKDTTIDIPIRELSDEDMLKIMANENMQEWATDWRIIAETVRQARDFLLLFPKILKRYKDVSKRKDVGARTIAKFLGSNWSYSTVGKALRIMEDKTIQKSISLLAMTNEEKKKSLNIQTLERISSIQKEEAKKEWLKEVVAKNISSHEIEEIARFENESSLSDHDKKIIRENILEGRIRGKEQIKEQVEFIKVRKLQEGKKDDEDKRREELKNFINKTDMATVSLSNKIGVLAEQFREHPETKKYLPQEETIKLSRSLTTLFVRIKQLLDITKSGKEERKENKKWQLEQK